MKQAATVLVKTSNLTLPIFVKQLEVKQKYLFYILKHSILNGWIFMLCNGRELIVMIRDLTKFTRLCHPQVKF
jgi:hypothetical protein